MVLFIYVLRTCTHVGLCNCTKYLVEVYVELTKLPRKYDLQHIMLYGVLRTLYTAILDFQGQIDDPFD